MAEVAVGLARHAGEFVLGNVVADERADDLDRDFGIGPAGKAGDRLRAELRPGRRHVEAAVAGEPRERHVDKSERRRLAPGGHIAHGCLALRPEIYASSPTRAGATFANATEDIHLSGGSSIRTGRRQHHRGYRPRHKKAHGGKALDCKAHGDVAAAAARRARSQNREHHHHDHGERVPGDRVLQMIVAKPELERARRGRPPGGCGASSSTKNGATSAQPLAAAIASGSRTNQMLRDRSPVGVNQVARLRPAHHADHLLWSRAISPPRLDGSCLPSGTKPRLMTTFPPPDSRAGANTQ